MSTDPLTSVTIDVPQGVDVTIGKDHVHVKGSKGELKRKFPHKSLSIKAEGGKILITPKEKSSQTRALLGSYNSHIKNMITGVQTPFIYTLKVVFTHFPITVSAAGSDFSVQNFLGEKKARKVKIPQGAKVSVQGDKITIEALDIELAGRVATLMEQATKIRNRDRRMFQDGIYIVEKGK